MELHTGHHLVVQLLGLNVNMDTLILTWVTAALVIIVSIAATRGRSLVPSGLQNAMEIVVESLLSQFKETLGPKYGQVVSVLLTMFLFILFGNEIGLLPSPHILASPTNDLNTTVALALVSSLMVHVMALRNQGLKKHLKHYLEPFPPFILINLLEEVTKPLTLAFRLFGNILAGEILMEVLYFLAPVGVPMVWLLFSLVIGLIQAFIFTILTTSYLRDSFTEE
ncbi:MAG: F0F1 ATP synthase subunit A [Megasphaera sp.]|jgi:F-type H+-transporting ATPase subunit a|nr:F0F1 ATP synthase subunit A [Megasphaera sp.]MCH4187467.1 F0F1 ATP synthase subunit A [Megasphaera sp.]MCH4217386.1 F0F1 ATP synthase subunit A [Megasphaera sp.]